MNPRDLGPCALQMQRLLVFFVVFVAIFITVLSGPQLAPPWSSPPDLMQWIIYSPNFILPAGAGLCAVIATFKAMIEHRHEYMWADSAWFVLLRLYLVCYLVLIVTCAVTPVDHLSSPIPPEYVNAIVSDTDPILALYPLAAVSCIAVLKGRYTAVYLSMTAPLQILAIMGVNPDAKLLETSVGPIYFLLYAMLNAGMLHWTLMIVRGLDEGRRNSHEAERALASAQARGRARARSNGLIHDYVLSALILAFNRSIDSSEVRAAADSALGALALESSSNETMDAAQMHGAFVALIRARQPHWTLSCHLPSDKWQIPVEVGDALIAATHEALNNVCIHAGTDSSDPSQPAKCHVELSIGVGSVCVTITDTGQGFNIDKLTKERHGVRESIIKRVESIGGKASLTSHPGVGTQVTLEWTDFQSRRFKPRQVIRSVFAWRQGAGVNIEDPSRIAWDSQVRAAAESRGARILLVLGVVVHVYMLAIEISHGAYYHIAPVIFSLVLMAVSGAALVAPWPNRVPPKLVAWGSAATIGVTNLLVLVMIRGESQWPGWSGWCGGASMFLAALLLVRQRTVEAIVGCVALVVAVAAWVAIQNRPPALVFTFSVGHILSFIFWFVLVQWSGAAASAIEKSLKTEEQAHLERELQVSINSAMAAKLADVSLRARGTLEAIRDDEMTDELAMEARLLEAELRDEIRAPFFTGTAVTAAARRARRRGIEVLLLDDRSAEGGLNIGKVSQNDLRNRIINQASVAIDGVKSGRVVVRVCPTNRRWAATILTEVGLSVIEA